MSKFAAGKHALGICDRCGLTYKLLRLHFQYIDGFQSSLRVCSDCMDIDHEQLRTENIKTDDAITLRDARPDRDLASQRALFGWNPIAGDSLVAHIGSVKVSTS